MTADGELLRASGNFRHVACINSVFAAVRWRTDWITPRCAKCWLSIRLQKISIGRSSHDWLHNESRDLRYFVITIAIVFLKQQLSCEQECCKVVDPE